MLEIQQAPQKSAYTIVKVKKAAKLLQNNEHRVQRKNKVEQTKAVGSI